MDQKYEFRKVIASNKNASLCINLPKNYTKNLEIEKGDTVKVQQIGESVTIRKVKEND